MAFPLEAVPNFSEGRNGEKLEAIQRALARQVRVLDVHTDPDHNRSVFTIAGEESELVDALVAGIRCARTLIDLRKHEGVHPRVGAADVVPIVFVRPGDAERARTAAMALGKRVGAELFLPVFLYGELANGRGPAYFRRGGLEELGKRLDAGELEPDFGPPQLDAAAGCVLVAARSPLIAFNVNLRTEDLDVARSIAALIREGGGGFSGVRALGFPLPSRGLVQVSINVEDPVAAPLHEVVERIAVEAAARSVEVAGSELVGLLPAVAAAAAAAPSLRLEALEASKLLEARLLEQAT